ncbi:DUF3035 domain-containing protein [Elioraea sp.]|jgi:hypothetical protein|uniref:DUF3035 domain-containing protein n=1 Tax=Elioraea sp. TaxID=2185103 RepID=UPI0021DCD6F4|nr:DUF3035 domain-containing protein [Elioraea sp.]GIX09661.1 MAG: hypothetical protein KatS3mg116_1371 [Elioraea sp.]
MNGRVLTALALAAPLLAACGGDAARTFGFTRDPPDEFQVQTRAPLSVPPEFSLRPPRPGAPRPQEPSAREQAQGILVARTVTPTQPLPPRAETSPGEAALLAAAGPPPPPDLRDRIEADNALIAERNRSFVDALMFWRSPRDPGVAVDPTREAQRLREAAALGRAPTEGETPIIQRRRRGLLEGLF